MLVQGAKGSPWEATSSHHPTTPPPPFSRTLLQRLYCCLGKSVPFCPEHCPEHPLPARLSGVGNFTKRDFALLGQGGGTVAGAPCVSPLG